MGLRERVWWPFVAGVAVFAYLYMLDGLYVPRIGDESPYIHIVRLTAESGSWLPLETPPGLQNTKPPFLFWLGIISTNWARHWSLLWLRLPIVIITFLTAGLVFLLAQRLAGGREGGYLAALAFLGFRSTFQYGRPFLTNMPETFFVFSPFFLLIYFRRRLDDWRWGLWIVAGLLLGVACLFKSFVLVVPVSLAFAWIFLSVRRWNWADLLKKDAAPIMLAVLLALLCFALWPLLDPEPGSVIRNFVLGENVSKLSGDGYWRGLFTGPYPVYRIWLAPLASAGFFALPLLYVTFLSWSRRERLGFEEKALWIVTFSFLIVYTFPSQRQENYLLPITPAVAVLLGVSWTKIPRRWFYVFLLPAGVALSLLYGLMLEVDSRAFSGNGYAPWHFAVPATALLVWAVSLLFNRLAPYTFQFLGILLLVSVTSLLAPFDGPDGRFDPKRVALLKGRTVYVPETFVSKHERHRFILPGARIEGYDPADLAHLDRLLRSRKYVVVHRPLGETIAGPYRTFARRLDLRTRQTRDEILRILFHRDLDPFIHQELIVRRLTAKRERPRSENLLETETSEINHDDQKVDSENRPRHERMVVRPPDDVVDRQRDDAEVRRQKPPPSG